MIIPFRVSGWLKSLLLKEANRSKVIREALVEYYTKRRNVHDSGRN